MYIGMRKYGVGATFDFGVYDVDGVDLDTDWTPAAADCELIKDGGTSTQCTNTAVDEGVTYSITLTATEMQCARGVIKVQDAATKVILDVVLTFTTYGNASAEHAFDLDTASTAQTGDSYARIGAPAGASIAADLVEIEGHTDDIGVAGAGLTDLGGSSNNWNTTTPLTAAGVRSAVGLASANMDTQFTASATATSVTVSDKTGFSLSTAGILAIWHQLTSAVVTASTMGKLLVDNINAAITSRATSAKQDTMETTLNAASTAAGLATAQSDLDKLTGTDGATLATAQGNYAPAKAGDNMGTVSSVTGNVDGSVASVTGAVGSVTAEVTADMTKLSGSATAADNLELSALTIISFTVTGTPTSTEVAATGLTAKTGGNKNIVGRYIIMTSGAAKHEVARITDYVDATGAMTVTEMILTVSASDTGIII